MERGSNRMNPIAQHLDDLTRKQSRIVVGMISGTSADSIDVAICRIKASGLHSADRPGTNVDLLHYDEEPYDPEVRRRILDVARLDVRGIAELHVKVGDIFARACVAAVLKAGLTPQDIDLIGSHGQTVYHHSSVPGTMRATLQVGDGDVIAEETEALVVSDFRARDIAAGGEGAPISPLADLILFGSRGPTRRAVLNLGGIANITVLDHDPERVFGFDTGPANSLLDRLARRLSRGELDCDRDSRIASAGQINEELVETLLKTDPYLARRPPKSTGFEMYGDAFIDRAAALHGGVDANLMATLTEFTARSVAGAFAQFVQPIDEVIAAGGGVCNPVLIQRIRELLAPARLLRSDDLGVPIEAREAMAFAILANEAIHGHTTSLPAVTGARRPAVLGKFCLPRV
jgi:anhydro-N-acetylmuramic acid kinase